MGNRARTEVTNSTRGVGGGSSNAVGGVVTSAGVSVGVGVSIAGTSNNTTLVVNGGDISELGADTEDGVERVSLGTGFGCLSIGGGLGSVAGFLRGLIGTAAVDEVVAHELGDDVNVLRRAVVVRGYRHSEYANRVGERR